jgi:competence ComEA-like helix-hairpin-helix protein
MSEKLDINVANAETLATISGIGPALAARIIEYRETVHPFEEVIELAAVPGISEKMVRGFEEFVTVQSGLEATAVPQNLEEPEDVILLAAPEPMELLPAPEPTTVASEEVAHVESPVAAEPDLAAETEDAEPEPEVEVEESVAAPETRSAPAEISPIPHADPVQDLRATLSSQPVADWEAKAQRRGCISTLLGATFGAILGAVLTLAILAAVNNGNINYAANDTEIRQQLDTEIISRTNELNQLSTRISVGATAEAAANQTLQTDLASANEALANNEEIISYLATRSGDFEERLQDVAGAADTFTGFLDGLRVLLGDLEGGSVTPTPAPAEETVSPTPTVTPLITRTPTSTPTTAVQPTRTPQPTATPFTFPTNTPAPQP